MAKYRCLVPDNEAGMKTGTSRIGHWCVCYCGLKLSWNNEIKHRIKTELSTAVSIGPCNTDLCTIIDQLEASKIHSNFSEG